MNRRSERALKTDGGTRPASDGASSNSRLDSGLSSVGSKSVQELEAEIALYRHALDKLREDFQAFAYSVSHDLRAPLRAIEGFSKILLEDYANELGEEPQRFLQHVITNGQQLSSQVEDLLKFYRAGKNPPTRIPVSAKTICKEALAMVGSALPKHVSVVQHELPDVSADPVQLREIFSLLLGNALKFSDKSPSPKIEIGAKVEPAATTFYVRDNGVGFDESGANRLFQVFQKLHSPAEFSGNGIGLAIVKRLVEAHGGCVSAHSKPGKGSVFCFSLPHDNNQKLTEPPSCHAVAA